MKKFSKEIQIALVAIVALLVLYFGLQFLKGMTLFSSNNRYFVKFQDVSGLAVASPIYANGYRVGVVEDVQFNYQNTGEIIASESGGTFTRSLTASEAEAFRVFAGRSESREGQRRQFAEDYAGYPQTYEDDRMQILWVTAYHQSPANALNVPKASNLAQLKANILATYPFGPYTTRYNTAYSLLSVWDGKSNPPAF